MPRSSNFRVRSGPGSAFYFKYMNLRVCSLLLSGAAWWCGESSLLAQDTAKAEAAAGIVPNRGEAQALAGSWSLDFWPRWPREKEYFKDCLASNWTDALARGYYLDPRSLSPDRHYGVIVPRFGVIHDGPNFVVEVPARRVVGAIGGPGFAFSPKAEVGWGCHWAPDSSAVVIEQNAESKKSWGHVIWRLVELHDGYIAKDTDLMKNHGKVPAWLDNKAIPTDERSKPVPDVSPAVLAESSPSVDAWSVQREGGIGPLHMVKGGAQVGTLASVKAVGADASGTVRELSSDEMPGLPISFFSFDEKWLFVNQIVRADPETGRQWRTAALYWRNDSAEDKALIWKAPMSGSFEDMAWDAFARRNLLPPQSVAPPDANGFRDRTIEFVNWSMKASRVLLYMRARNGAVVDKSGRPAYYRWYCYFNTTKLAFEPPSELEDLNKELKTRWTSGNESVKPDRVPLRVSDAENSTTFAPYTDPDPEAEAALNQNYKVLLERLGKDGAEKVRKKQRAWLLYRDTLAQVHALNRWSEFTDAALLEGRFLTTSRRADEFEQEAIAASNGKPNTAIREKSPDGKFAMLYTFADDNISQGGMPHGAELVTLPDRRTVMDLFSEGGNRGMQGYWSADSKYFLFHASSRRVGDVAVYERRGQEFEELKWPEGVMDKYGPKPRKGEKSYHYDGVDVSFVRWLGPKKFLAHRVEQFDVEDGNGNQRTIAADYDLVIAIEKGKLVIEKATKTKSDN